MSGCTTIRTIPKYQHIITLAEYDFENKIELTLDRALVLKLALDWKHDNTYKDIEFDLINMRWRCEVCVKAKMTETGGSGF